MQNFPDFYGENFLLNLNNYKFNMHISGVDSYYKPHKHGFSELVIITGGSAVHIVNEHKFNIRSGDVFIVKGGTLHGYVEAKEMKLINLYYMDSIFVSIGESVWRLPGFEQFFIETPRMESYSHEHNLFHLGHDELDFSTHLAELMLQAISHEGPRTDIIVKMLFFSLVAYLSTRFQAKQIMSPHAINLISQITEYLNIHYRSAIKISELAGMFGLSERHLNRLFVKYCGCTPTEYLRGLRMGKASDMLFNLNISVKEIAEACGFTDFAYFSRQFKDYYGISPSQYRKFISPWSSGD